MSLNQLDQGFGKTTLFADRSLTSTGDVVDHLGDDELNSSESPHLSLIALLLRELGDDFHKECKLRSTCGVWAAPCVPCSVISQGTLLLLSSCNRILQFFGRVVTITGACQVFLALGCEVVAYGWQCRALSGGSLHGGTALRLEAKEMMAVVGGIACGWHGPLVQGTTMGHPVQYSAPLFAARRLGLSTVALPAHSTATPPDGIMVHSKTADEQ